MKKLINNINEDYCSFEVMELLSSKGFDVPNYAGTYVGIGDNLKYTCTHALAIEWIRVNFGHMICYSVPEYHNGKVKFSYYIVHDDGFGVAFKKQGDLFNSPQEATEAALLYTLKNLI